jgi:hypothetical protein
VDEDGNAIQKGRSMSFDYQLRDGHFMDYKLYRLPGVNTYFRGPALTSERYIACVGAAQTFGRFVAEPFPVLLSRRMGIETLNLGRGAAGPTFPLSNPILMKHINLAQLAIVQVVSGRSQSNSLFHVKNHGMIGINQVDGREMVASDFYEGLMKQDERLAREIVAETRANYVRTMTELLNSIQVPKILFWFSVRTPEYQERWQPPAHGIFAEFPQLVNRQMVDELRPYCQRYVECISRTGLPQPLPPREEAETAKLDLPERLPQAELTSTNRYYPSPEMHEEAAALLDPICREMLEEKALANQ